MGIEQFFKPGNEILVADGAEDVVAYLRNISPSQALEIGARMRQRALRDHSYALRARQCDVIVADALTAPTIAGI